MFKMKFSIALMLAVLILVSVNTLTASQENWQQKVYLPLAYEKSSKFCIVDFIDTNIVWIAGIEGNAYKSVNGGKDFQKASLPYSGERADFCFVNKDTGYVAGRDGDVYRTIDGGENWTSVKVSDDWLGAVAFSDSKTVWVTGEYAQIKKSTDAGLTWSISKDFGYEGDYYDIFFVDGTTGWAVGSGNILKTEDGGEDWFTIENTQIYSFRKIKFLDQNNGWAVGRWSSSVHKTTNGGITWTSHETEFSASLKDVCMIDYQYGWATGVKRHTSNSLIYFTTNSGDTWELEMEVENTELLCVGFFDRSHGLVGGKGTNLELREDIIYVYNKEDLTLPATISADCPDRKLDFDLRNSQNKSITISNTGGEQLIISNIELQNSQSSSFDISSDFSFPLEVSPGSAVQLSISFTSPGNEDEQNALVKIHSNAANAPTFEITLSASHVNSVNSHIGSRGFELFPNPASDFITIKTNCCSNNQIAINQSLKIYNIFGELVKEVKSISESQNIYIDDLPTGVYYLKIGSHCSFFIKD